MGQSPKEMVFLDVIASLQLGMWSFGGDKTSTLAIVVACQLPFVNFTQNCHAMKTVMQSRLQNGVEFCMKFNAHDKSD